MGDNQVNSAKLEHQLISLICYQISSARGLVDEPKIYGPSRLVEAARRAIDLAEDLGIQRGSLAEVSRRIEEGRLEALMKDEETFIRFLDDLVELLATWLRDAEGTLEAGDERC
jgi:hypothetical protein